MSVVRRGAPPAFPNHAGRVSKYVMTEFMRPCLSALETGVTRSTARFGLIDRRIERGWMTEETPECDAPWEWRRDACRTTSPEYEGERPAADPSITRPPRRPGAV